MRRSRSKQQPSKERDDEQDIRDRRRHDEVLQARHQGGRLPGLAKEAGTKALADAGIPYEDVEEAFAGYCYGDSTYGQRAIYQLGLTGIPVVNVNNNCSTGSSALYLARRAIKGGLVDCALAVGFEKMEKGSLGMKYTDRTPALDKHIGRMFEVREPERVAVRAADVRQRRPRPHGQVRGPSPSTSPGSAGRTTSIRSTTRTRSSRTSTRSTRSRTRG